MCTGVHRSLLALHYLIHMSSVLANRVPLNVWGGGGYTSLARIEREKGHLVFFNCISVTDGIKINEQNKLIGIGPLYLQTEFEVI